MRFWLLSTEIKEMLYLASIYGKSVYYAVLASIYGNKGDVIFVYGHGGTGKTYLWQTIISRVRSEGKIVLAVASSGIASLLLPGGRTAHSRFKIPIKIDDFSTCEIKRGSQLADLLTHTSLIVWDEAPMNHRNYFEALDRSLKDIVQVEESTDGEKLFGGKTVLLGGDFRQILPVVTGGTRQDIIGASLTKSYIWDECKVFRLKTNMRLQQNSISNSTRRLMLEFAEWILDLGDGKLETVEVEGEDEATWIKIPDDINIHAPVNGVQTIVSMIYNNFDKEFNCPTYLECKSAVKSYGEQFCCVQCGNNDEPPMPWYKLDGTVADETGDANFTIFGRVAQELIHIPAQNLATADDSDRFTLPSVIKNIIGEKYIFQVMIVMIDTYKLGMGIRSFKVNKSFFFEVPTKVQNQFYQKDQPEIEEQLVLTPSVHTQNDIFGEVSLSEITHSRLSTDVAKLPSSIEEPRRKRFRLSEDKEASTSNK